MERDKEVFCYTYSAKEQEEIRRIRDRYDTKGEDKLEQLRRLDKSVTKKGTVTSLVLGILGTLLLGIGMSCVLVWGESSFVYGIVIGTIGIVGIASAYPVYSMLTRAERERVAPEILRLAEELMK